MYMSDRAVAAIYFFMGVLVPIAWWGLYPLQPPPTPNLAPIFQQSQAIKIAMLVVFAAFMWCIAAWLYARNRPVFGGRTEDETRRRIKQWYRDAKKWMDEHPENVEMKDL